MNAALNLILSTCWRDLPTFYYEMRGSREETAVVRPDLAKTLLHRGRDMNRIQGPKWDCVGQSSSQDLGLAQNSIRDGNQKPYGRLYVIEKELAQRHGVCGR